MFSSAVLLMSSVIYLAIPGLCSDNPAYIGFQHSFCNFSNKELTICELSNVTEAYLVRDSLYPSNEVGVEEIQLNGANRLIIQEACFPKTTVTGALSFSALIIRSKIFWQGVPCKTSLNVERSTVDKIIGGVNDVSLSSSVLENISVGELTDFNSNHSTLNNIEYLSWNRNGKILNSIVRNVSYMRANNLVIEDSFMDDFKSFSLFSHGVYLHVRETSINSMERHSWIVESEEFTMENVEIGSIKKLGLLVLSKTVTFRNVSIMTTESPFITLPVDSNVIFDSVKINGVDVSIDGPMVLKEVNPFLRINIDEETDKCESLGNSLLNCNFRSVPKITFFLARQLMEKYETVQISNALDLEVDRLPEGRLYVVNSTVQFLNPESYACEGCRSSLFLRNSTVTSEVPRGMYTLYADNSMLQKVEADDRTKDLLLFNTQITDLSAKMSRNSVVSIFKCEINTFGRSNFLSPVSIVHCIIRELKEIAYNHPEQESMFYRTQVNFIENQGLKVYGGTLKYVSNDIRRANAPFLFVHLNGELVVELQNSTYPRNLDKMIIATSYDDVRFTSDKITKPWPVKSNLVQVADKKELPYIIKDPNQEVVIDQDSTICTTTKGPSNEMTCDFTNKPEKSLHVFLGLAFAPESLTLQNIKELTLWPTCSEKIKINNVHDGKVLMERAGCSATNLSIFNSTLESIYTGVDSMTLRESVVGNLTVLQNNVSLYNTKIGNIPGVICINCVIQDSVVDHISNWRVAGNLEISNSKITSVEQDAFMFLEGENNEIADTYFGRMGTAGIIVDSYAKLLIRNTEFDFVEKFPIFLRGGSLVLENVSFSAGSGSVIGYNTTQPLQLICRNVTIQGLPAPCFNEIGKISFPWTIEFPNEQPNQIIPLN